MLLLLVQLAYAQSRLPVLVAEVPAAWPPEAIVAGQEAAVLLELDVDATGAVVAARIVEPSGVPFGAGPGGFDEAAVTAARQFRFEPAIDESGNPSGARIQYRYRFTLEKAALAPPPPPPVEPTPPPEPQRAPPQNETVFIEAERPSTEVSERTLDQETVRYLPGTGGDVVKVVQNLPGVAHAPLGVGQLIIRGTAPEDSAYSLDGSRIPLVFHFSGLSTVLNGDLVAEVAYLPGNYSARYGRALGGYVDLRTKEELPAATRGYVALDLFQGTAYTDVRVGPKTGIEFSLRRSWIDAVLTPVLSSVGDSSVQAPRYWDAQARVLHSLDNGGTLDVLGLFSDDRFAVVGAENDQVTIGLSTTFGKVRARWIQPLGGDWGSEMVAMAGPEGQLFAFDGDPEAAYERTLAVGLREELVRPQETGQIGWRLGGELGGGRGAFRYDVANFGSVEAGDGMYFAPAAWVEPSIGLGRFLVTPALRADALVWDDGYVAGALDPRLGVRLAAAANTTVKLGVGKYSQFPTQRQVDPGADGVLELTPSWALQTSLGIDEQLPGPFSAGVTAYYNRLYDLVVGREDRFRFFTGAPESGPFDTEPYANAGTGRVCGVEISGKMQTERSVAMISGTFSNSARVARDGTEALFRYDQPWVLNALASHELPRGWRLGGRFRASAGDPYTPVANRVYDLSSRSFLPVFGEPDSARLPPFWSVDLRVDKEWRFKVWSLTAYLDLQNALNVTNPEVMSWTWDYGDEAPIEGLPIIPAFGLRGEWGGVR